MSRSSVHNESENARTDLRSAQNETRVLSFPQRENDTLEKELDLSRGMIFAAFLSPSDGVQKMAGSRPPRPTCFTNSAPNDSGTMCLTRSPAPGPATHSSASRPPRSSKSHNQSWQRFLDSYGDWSQGPPIAFESEAHRQKSQQAWDAVWSPLNDALPAGSETKYRLQLVGDRLPRKVVEADITINQFSDSANSPVTDIKSLAGDIANVLFKIPKTGQAEHFQAFRYQKQIEAFRWGLNEIFTNANKAIREFMEWPPGSKFDDYNMSDDEHDRDRDARYSARTANFLSHGIHPLQDSFSPAHVVREWDEGIPKIRKITVWREQTEEEHKAGDKDWHDPHDGHESWGDTAMKATELLLNYFIWCVLSKPEKAIEARKSLLLTYFIFEPKQ